MHSAIAAGYVSALHSRHVPKRSTKTLPVSAEHQPPKTHPWWRRWSMKSYTPQPPPRLQADTHSSGPPPQQPSAAAPHPNQPPPGTHPIREVYENQRWFGLAWTSPVALLDWPSYSDADGNPAIFDAPPSLEADSSWEVVVTPGTDRDGWQYGTVFQHLSHKRPGGRVSQRLGDSVRRRAWRRVDSSAAATAVDGPESGTIKNIRGKGVASSAADVAVAAQREAEAKRRAIRSFIGMVLDLLSRRKLWNIVPWDPSALVVLQKEHQETYQQLQAQAQARRLLRPDEPPPPSSIRSDGTLLQDLMTAAVHSRAAYGFAMQAGHISSVASYIRLQTLQPLTFNAVAGVSEESNNEAVAALTGLPVEDILEAQWRNQSFRPCHYVAIDRAAGCVVISIRGSLEIGDLLSDLSAHPMECSMGGVDGWVHQGILAAASYVHCSTQAALEEAARRAPGFPVLITGHSLGGGVAALLTMLLRDAGGIPGLGPIQAITVGTAAVMSAPLAAACDDCVVSIIVGSDIIPHLSYASVERLLVEMSEASPVRRAAQGLTKKLSRVLNCWGAIIGDFEAAHDDSPTTRTGTGSASGGGVSTQVQADGNHGGAAAAAARQSQRWGPVKKAGAEHYRSSPHVGLGDVRQIAQEGRKTPLSEQTRDPETKGLEGPPSASSSAAAASAAAAGGGGGGVNGIHGPQSDDRKSTQSGARPLNESKVIPVIDLSQSPDAEAFQRQLDALQKSAARADSRDEVHKVVLETGEKHQVDVPGPSTSPTLTSSERIAVSSRQDDPDEEAGRPTSQTIDAAGAVSSIEASKAQKPASMVVLPYAPGAPDASMLDAAMAQETASTSSEAAAAMDGKEAAGADASRQPGDPEVLFPPGRLIWIFPSDEDVGTVVDSSSDVGGAGNLPQDAFSNGALRKKQRRGGDGGDEAMGEEVRVHGDAALKIVETWDVAWQGTVDAEEEEEEKEKAKASDAGAASALPRRDKAVDVAEAGAAVDNTGDRVQQNGSSEEEKGRKSSLPVAAEAERSTFERMLLLPDCINDHLPDRYIDAIRQL